MLKTSATAGGIAAVVNAVIWLIGNFIGDGMAVPVPAVVIFSFVMVVLGGILYFVLSRFLGTRTNLVFIILSVLFLLVNATAPISAMTVSPMPGLIPVFNTATVVATELMHLVAGGLAIQRLTALGK